MIVVGIDENGLGPVLGPMVVTACAFRTDSYAPDLFWSLASEDLPADDSKVVFKQNKKKAAESAVLKWLRLFEQLPDNANALYKGICHHPPLPCPVGNAYVCRPAIPLAIPQFGAAQPAISTEIAARFEALKISPLACASYAICPGVFNQSLANGAMNKLQFDFHLMIQLIDWVRERHPGETVLALCGKVGGTRCYLPWFSAEKKSDVLPIIEERDQSRYSLTSDVEVAFIKDGDSLHLPIAVASMIGKYVRELQMTEINVLLAPGEKHVSGYRDPRTKSFIRQTESNRAQIGLPDSCFLRNS